MSNYSTPTNRRLTVIAQDPGVRTAKGGVLMTRVNVPAETLLAGPRGHRVQVVDFDSSKNVFYKSGASRLDKDLYLDIDDGKVLESDPQFHAQNVYAIVSSTILNFEKALGRHVNWGFDYGTHQIKVAPHAFSEANAFYSRRDEGLLFGYFPSKNRKKKIFTCLSHDIVVHETTHALLDGLKRQYIRPSSADQAAFHEAYADIVALLSVFSSQDLVGHGLSSLRRDEDGTCSLKDVEQTIYDSFLSGLAEQMGTELLGLNRNALRRSIDLPPSPRYLKMAAYEEPHLRGEVLVAAVMQAFIHVWWRRLIGKSGIKTIFDHKLRPSVANKKVEVWRVIEEGATAAKHLLQLVIRALDYMPPVDICFGDFLSAVVTADSEACPDDSRYEYRKRLLQSFADYGIKPSSSNARVPGRWATPVGNFTYGHSHFEPMRWDREAVFRFIWENQTPLNLTKKALTTVESVKPVVRIAPDGFTLNEVVVEYFQSIALRADELQAMNVRKPKEMPAWQTVQLYGGSTLIFDEFGRLKFDIGNHINSPQQNEKLEALWARGAFKKEFSTERTFARLHREKSLRQSILTGEQW